MVSTRASGALFFAAAMLAAAPSYADDDGWPAGWKDRDVGIAFAETFVTRTHLQSPLPVNGDDAPRRLVGLGFPGGSATMFGVGAGVERRIGLMTLRLLELRYSVSASGASGDGVANTSPVFVETGPIHVLEVGTGIPLPGLQWAPEGGSWKASFGLAFGLGRLWTTATMHESNGVLTNGGIGLLYPYARANLSPCMRLGNAIPYASGSHSSQGWACLTAQPLLYSTEWFAGGSLGLRVEM